MAASELFSKCTQRLQTGIKNGSDLSVLEKDGIKMKQAIRSFAMAYKLNAHPLLYVIDVVKALFNIKQQDDVDVKPTERN